MDPQRHQHRLYINGKYRLLLLNGDPYEIRTRVAGVRGPSLRPLDQRATYHMDSLKEYVAPSGTRTLDTLIKSQVLYQLS